MYNPDHNNTSIRCNSSVGNRRKDKKLLATKMYFWRAVAGNQDQIKFHVENFLYEVEKLKTL